MIRALSIGIAGLLGAATVPLSAFAIDTSNKAQQPLSKPELHRIVRAITPEIESMIAEHFSAGRCDEVVKLVRKEEYPDLRPLVAAVVAYCSPSRAEAEALFDAAEKKDPNNDTVLLLHARYLWKLNKEASMPIWHRVLKITRRAVTKEMAKDYLEGTVEDGENDAIKIGKLWTYSAMVQSGMSSESNPAALPISDPAISSASSNGANFTLIGGAQRSTNFGSVAANYSFVNNRYSLHHEADFLSHLLEFPITMKVDTNADLSFRPFAYASTLGNQEFQEYFGLGVLGWLYRSNFNQSVQGIIYQDHYAPTDLSPQQGLHFRLEYNWEFYPELWFFKFQFAFEHVAAAIDSDPNSNSAITYSHNDIGLQGMAEYNFPLITFGMRTSLLTRQDDNDSVYPPALETAPLISKRRQDFQVVLSPYFNVPITQKLQLLGWYEFNRVYSNMNYADYADRNVRNEVFGLALRAYAGTH